MVVPHGGERTGVYGAIAQEFVNRAVVLIGPRAGDDVDLATAGTSHVGCIAAGLYLELHYGVGRGAEILRVEGRVGVGRAVKQEEVGVGASAADHDGRALAGAPIKRIRFSGLRTKANVSAGHGEDEVDEHAPVDREFLNGLGFDDIADAGVG